MFGGKVGKENQQVKCRRRCRVNGARAKTTCFLNRDKAYKILVPKHLIHQRPHAMHILIPNLHEDRPAVRQQIARHRQPVAQVGEIASESHPARYPETPSPAPARA